MFFSYRELLKYRASLPGKTVEAKTLRSLKKQLYTIMEMV